MTEKTQPEEKTEKPVAAQLLLDLPLKKTEPLILAQDDPPKGDLLLG